MTSIGSSAFYDCHIITASIPTIACKAINNKELKEVNITSGEFIEMESFKGCDSLTSITISDSVTNIGAYAFYGCKSLASVIFGNGVTSIEYEAFDGCTSLTSINIPDSVSYIGDGAFYGCSSLSYNIKENIKYLGNSKNSFIVVMGVTDNALSLYKIDKGAKFLHSNAFEGCASLTNITIPDGMTSIGSYAFKNCRSLTSINIPDGMTSIGNYAFKNCSSLTNINIPDGMMSIGGYAFENCSSLASINIPDSVTRIGYSAFSGCSSLKGVYITDIAAWCNIWFGGDYGNPLEYAHNLYLNNELVTDLVIPDGVTSIGKYAFYGCGSLTSITIPYSVMQIGDDAFSGCRSLTDITYKGTVEEWRVMEQWGKCISGGVIVHCTDGDIYYGSTK